MAGGVEKFSFHTGESGRAAGIVKEQRKWPNDRAEMNVWFALAVSPWKPLTQGVLIKSGAESLCHHHTEFPHPRAGSLPWYRAVPAPVSCKRWGKAGIFWGVQCQQGQ